MIIDKYLVPLKEVENKFDAYKKDIPAIIKKVSAVIAHTVITKGSIINFTPFYEERLGDKLNGKVLQTPVISDDCRKYHFDSSSRIVMTEEYSVFLQKFRVREIYFYHEFTEKLLVSGGRLERLFIFDHPFANTELCLSYAGIHGYAVEEFVYDGDILREINVGRNDGDYKETFVYEKTKLVMIQKTFPSGAKRLLYTTKKPDFNKIRTDIYAALKKAIISHGDAFHAIGIEGFIDQQTPELCVCFTGEDQPDALIADWKTEMCSIEIYDWQLNPEQERKCVKIIAEILVELVNEGLLKDKEIFFHQHQECVSAFYPGAKSVFKKSGLPVK